MIAYSKYKAHTEPLYKAYRQSANSPDRACRSCTDSSLLISKFIRQSSPFSCRFLAVHLHVPPRELTVHLQVHRCSSVCSFDKAYRSSAGSSLFISRFLRQSLPFICRFLAVLLHVPPTKFTVHLQVLRCSSACSFDKAYRSSAGSLLFISRFLRQSLPYIFRLIAVHLQVPPTELTVHLQIQPPTKLTVHLHVLRCSSACSSDRAYRSSAGFSDSVPRRNRSYTGHQTPLSDRSACWRSSPLHNSPHLGSSLSLSETRHVPTRTSHTPAKQTQRHSHQGHTWLIYINWAWIRHHIHFVWGAFIHGLTWMAI